MKEREIMFEAEGFNLTVLDMADFNNPIICAVVNENGELLSGSLTVPELAKAKSHLERLQSI